MVDVATRLLPYQTPKLEVVASLPVSRSIHSYSDDELKAIVIDAYERERDSTEDSVRPANGASTPMLEHNDDVLPYRKNR